VSKGLLRGCFGILSLTLVISITSFAVNYMLADSEECKAHLLIPYSWQSLKCVPPDGFFGIQISQNFDRALPPRPHRVYDAATDPLMHWGSQSLWTPSASSCRLFQHDLLKLMAPMFATQPKMRKTTSPLARQLIPLVDGKWSLINTCHHTWAPQRWSFWLIIRCYTNVMLAYLLTLSKWQGIGR